MSINNRKTYESIKLTDKGKYIVTYLLCNGGQVTYNSSVKVKRQKY